MPRRGYREFSTHALEGSELSDLVPYFKEIDKQIDREVESGDTIMEVLTKLQEVAFYWLEGRVNEFFVKQDVDIDEIRDGFLKFNINCKPIKTDAVITHVVKIRLFQEPQWWDGGNDDSV